MILRFIVIIFLTSNTLFGQETFTVKYFGLTVHPAGDLTADLQPYKLDDRAVFVANFGGFVGFEKYFYEDIISGKTIGAIFTDCSGGFATVGHIGVRGTLYKSKKHRFYIGIGPTFLVRDSWTRFGDQYNSSGFFNVRETQQFGTVQWKFIPYGMELEYDYAFSLSDQLSVSFTPGIPLAAILSVGWKHWFNYKEFKQFKVYKP